MEKSNKRRYTLIVISFLFLLVATFVTVYNFKDTRAEETDAVVSTSTKATCKGASNFVFRSDGISGCEMTINTLKNIGITNINILFDMNPYILSFDASDIKSIYDIQVNKIKSVYAILKSSIDMSKETRDVILNSMKLLVSDVGNDYWNQRI